MAIQTQDTVKQLFELVSSAPLLRDGVRAGLDDPEVIFLREEAHKGGLEDLAKALFDPQTCALVGGVLHGSPYLSGLIKTDLKRFQRVLCSPPLILYEDLIQSVSHLAHDARKIEDAMRGLRVFKNEMALLLALADLGGIWPVMNITAKLSETAQTALQTAVGFLFQQAILKGDWLVEGDAQFADPLKVAGSSGYIVLGMGKFGAYELNYSSDIDLIVFFDPDLASLREGIEAHRFFVKMTRDLVRLMDERTADGYVFRTDLRLRPDPGATQVALPVAAAMVYYESFGQNWERAALIKARPVAGDLSAGAAILKEIQPFVWRKYLDFAAIADIQAMKRQIHAFHGFGEIAVAGHNIKIGLGGIREIEFFVQTQQLIAGGRQRDLRTRGTLETLDGLVERGWIKPDVRDELIKAYKFLRTIEHRIQMVHDEQTQQLPDTEERLEAFANFCGYKDAKAFGDDLLKVLNLVQERFRGLFKDEPSPTASGRNLVFAGQEDDPATVAALKDFGFSRPESVISTVRSWHHGRYAAVRSTASREQLTAVQGVLIEALSETADPDMAFVSFDRFLASLPTGVQLFSLLRSKPGLLRLVADIMGSAPRLASILSRRHRLLDAVIDPRTFDELPNEKVLTELVELELSRAASFEEALDSARIIGGEQSFLIGVRVLSGTINADQAGAAYAVLATSLINVLQERTEKELEKSFGRVPGGGAVVIAMGKLGGREMTASSDIDIIVVYDHPDDAVATDGARPLSTSQYFTRFTQRLITALAAPTAEGSLYEVDMRLRPSGQQGPVATRLSSFVKYQADEAWTWEHMALLRARVISGPSELRLRVEDAIRHALERKRDADLIAQDVREMRSRIAAEKGSESIWDLKQVRGGLVDLEFIAQYLQLIHVHDHPQVLDQNTLRAFQKLRDLGLLESKYADVLIPATRLIHNLTQVLRICITERFESESAPQGLKDLLARAGAMPSFEVLEDTLRETLKQVFDAFEEIVKPTRPV